MGWPRSLLIPCLAVLLLTTFPAQAERRVALVIGNAAYEHVPALANPNNDATDMAEKLQGLGFEVVSGIDLDLARLRATVREFIGKLDGADMALFFYAGHGLQVSGANYIAPVDAKLASHNDLDFEALPIDLVLSAMERSTKVNLIFLDACRDNPLADNLARSMGTRSGAVGRGLAKIGSGVGSLIAFATQPGNIAFDGKGRNSPFTAGLLRHLGTPGQSVTDDLILVRNAVLEATGGRQVPWDNSSLTGRVVLVEDVARQQADVQERADRAVELAYWDSIKDLGEKGYFEAYLRQYPQGAFAALARLKIASLEAKASGRESEPALAERSIEIAYWDSIKGAASIGYFEAYLKRWPNGTFADIARLRIKELSAAKAPASEPAKPAPPKVEMRSADAGSQAVADPPEQVAALANRSALSAPSAPVAPSDPPVPPDATAEVEAASLGPSATDPAETVPQVPAGATELIRAVQAELNRLGCSVGRVDGNWGRGSEKALREFHRHRGTKLAALEPDSELLERLKATPARVCPLECAKGMEARNGRCERIEREASVEPAAEPRDEAKPASRPTADSDSRTCYSCKLSNTTERETICLGTNETLSARTSLAATCRPLADRAPAKPEAPAKAVEARTCKVCQPRWHGRQATRYCLTELEWARSGPDFYWCR